MALRMKSLPSAEILHECFSYDPMTGIALWRERPLRHFKTKRGGKIANRLFANKKAGVRMKCGHQLVCISRNKYLLHRVIWKLVTGNDPVDEIDHKNGDPSDNRFNNLREATRYQQMQNSRPKSKNGFPKGVSRNGDKKYVWFKAEITANGKRIYLGNFKTPEEAYAVYCEAAKRLHGEFAKLDRIDLPLYIASHPDDLSS